ncbi:WD repeat-containing protein 60 [Phytophthora boehmeriae]|uniref:WD repeat-containing protein 60 n=1 Tax=Phytophthora boehmeriae TaxID=109152 RepID=A0A8T1WUL3_9STRA|nr:WD repeat-containing protein 60 [Phytophthora boehmeriae]
MPFGKKPKTNKDGKPRKQREGWGRFNSVLNERSVDFNLTLDVQNLRQEVQNLTSLRDILSTQSLVKRQTFEGSLARTVREYFHVFRQGAILRESGRKRLMDDRDQRAFLHSIMDEKVDMGNGLYGPDVWMDQLVKYSRFVRCILMQAQVHSIVEVENCVLLSVKGSFRFQVLRNTIETIFPHVMGHEWIVAQLIGQEIDVPARATFHFNTEGKCCKYDVDMDFVEAFMTVIKDPMIVKALLGRALIAENAMLGVIEEVAPDSSLEEEDKVEAIRKPNENCGQRQQKTSTTKEGPSCKSIVCKRTGPQEFCWRIVADYFAAFAHGYEKESDENVAPSMDSFQHDFLLHRFTQGPGKTADRVKERWQTLSECFEVLSFQQKGEPYLECDDCNSKCHVESVARYTLRIAPYTLQSVFPHVATDSPVFDELLRKVIVVPSTIIFSIEKSSGRIAQVTDQMDFAAALAKLLPLQDELSFVLAKAHLTKGGVSSSISEVLPSMAAPQQTKHPRPIQANNRQEVNKPTSSRTMSMADILR